ncbi:hypothetical protein Scep_009969 [Stephania cephalantha]|uniref:Uncharacterized protein n=1 Tax=Stephania cephalantha TaxID=152367 RepID=A0AAP0PCY1_9MAGN
MSPGDHHVDLCRLYDPDQTANHLAEVSSPVFAGPDLSSVSLVYDQTENSKLADSDVYVDLAAQPEPLIDWPFEQDMSRVRGTCRKSLPVYELH